MLFFQGQTYSDMEGHCIVKAPEDGVLTEADIPELVERLCDVCHKWKIIGIKLGLPLSKLDAMSQKYHFSDRIEIFFHVLQEWMKCCVNHAPPTWALLLEVLNSRVVGECSRAEKIRASFIHHCSKDDETESGNVKNDISETVCDEVSTSSNSDLCGRLCIIIIISWAD